MSISVALCTHNGEKFLREQLQSIAQQTLLPTELVVSDDASTDGTLKTVKYFAENAPFPVKILENNPALRTTKNFENALRNCGGDIVFLCDQDDVWLPQKVEKLHSYLLENQEIDLVFSDALLVNQNLDSLGKTIFEEVRFREKEKQNWRADKAIDVLIQGNRVTGCTVALRRQALDSLMPFPTDLAHRDFIHDTWLAWALAVQNRIQFFDEPLTLYRQHANNQIGTQAKNRPQEVGFGKRFSRPRIEKIAPLQDQWKYFEGILTMLRGRVGVGEVQNKNLEKIQRASSHYECRATLPMATLKRIIPVWQQLGKGNYHHFTNPEARFYTPWLAVFGDLFE